ncbi:MAG: 2-amino-4-hydroxy-6-hydroxymethyldihydropteridine diphosphokinase [Rhodoferax sp.]|nr:2-amino-4-hydroxy-6-hydroxymethyldihydropteridine diphosphokinase [Rhodoferax sp.]
MTAHLRAPVLAFIALGGNLGDANALVGAAVEQMATLPQTRLVARSGLYRTAPIEASGPDFINAVVAVQTRLNVHQLLMNLQRVEQVFGRERPYPNAPRTLDLDLLLYGTASIQSATLVVPHPRMTQRAFVLRPLAEIAPERVSADQLAAVATQRTARLPNE